MKKILKWGAIAFVGIIVLALIFGGGDNETQTTNTQTTQEQATESAQKTESKGVTMEQFSQLETGMTYEDAVEILGSEGEVLSETGIAGTDTVMYQWDGSSFASNMNATFQNGKLVSKAQFGLE